MKEFYSILKYVSYKSQFNYHHEYFIPEIFLNGKSPSSVISISNPYKFFRDKFFEIINISKNNVTKSNSDDISNEIKDGDIIYQSFIRNFASLNNEVGTALKQIAFLPFLFEKIGITKFISLPNSPIGNTNKKGKMGSPFAIKNPFDIDSMLSDPLLPSEFSPLFQYKALIQACSLLNIQTGSIVPLGTLSIDCHLFRLFPDLGFWWIAEPGDKIFCENLGFESYRSANCSSCNDLTPDLSYRQKQLFTDPPRNNNVKSVYINGEEFCFSEIKLNGECHIITLANAFPDVFADCFATYTWGDVASINFSRNIVPQPMGVQCLSNDVETTIAYQIIPHIIAWRAIELGESIFTIDVSSSIPNDIIARAKTIAKYPPKNYISNLKLLMSPDLKKDEAKSVLTKLNNLTKPQLPNNKNSLRLFFIEEELWNFNKKNIDSDAIVGPLIFCVSCHTKNLPIFLESMKYHLALLEGNAKNCLYTTGVCNHDTMPPSPSFANRLNAFFYFLPHSIFCVFSGSEFCAQNITNKEFGFNTSEELINIRNKLTEEKLGLFNKKVIKWDCLPNIYKQKKLYLHEYIKELDEIKNIIKKEKLNHYKFFQLDHYSDCCIGYIRYDHTKSNRALYIIANWDPKNAHSILWPFKDSEIIFSFPNGYCGLNLFNDKEFTLSQLSIYVAISLQL